MRETFVAVDHPAGFHEQERAVARMEALAGTSQQALPVDDFRAVQLLVRFVLAQGDRTAADASDQNSKT